MKLNANEIPEVAMPFMQATHLEEITMLNEIFQLLEQEGFEKNTPDLANKIEALHLHTHAHFSREEEQMLVYNFPPYPIHKQAHDEYLREFDALIDTWRNNGDVAPVASFLIKNTPAWMMQHISTMDFVTANFLAQCSDS